MPPCRKWRSTRLTAGEVLDYLDHNELGLAFAVLVEELDRLRVTPSPDAMTRLSDAYDRVASPSDGADAWARLKQRTSARLQASFPNAGPGQRLSGALGMKGDLGLRSIAHHRVGPELADL